MTRRSPRAIQIDQDIGRNIRRRMSIVGVDLVKLATAVGMRPDTLQCALNGNARLGAAHVHAVCVVLAMPIQMVFEPPT